MQKLIKTQNLPQSVGGKPNETQEPDKQALPPCIRERVSEGGKEKEGVEREREGGYSLVVVHSKELSSSSQKIPTDLYSQ